MVYLSFRIFDSIRQHYILGAFEKCVSGKVRDVVKKKSKKNREQRF